MKPAQIRVFDGLRISTDHVNHLQGAFASGLEDIRQILGLGKPQAGLEVSVKDDGSATIQPGVAFDFQKNRLTCDDPITLKLIFAPKEKSKFICLKYEQVEDGAVEGHPTMIWDSCSALVRDAIPDPKENLVTVAQVDKDADGKLHVRAAAGESPAPPTPPPPTPPPIQAGGTGIQPVASPQPEPPVPAPAPLPVPQLLLRQGVLQLASDATAGSYLRSVLAPALRKKMGPDAIELSFTLAQAGLAPDIRVSGFTTHCVLSGDLAFPDTRHHFECVANGESTAGAGTMPQFAACLSQMHPVPAASATLWSGSELTGRGLAQFNWARWSDAPDTARPPLPADVLAGLQLLVQLDPADQGFQMSVKLLWSGTIGEQSLQGLETQDIGFTWQVFFGWKAVGF